MEPIQNFFNIDWRALGIAVFTALIGFQAIVKAFNWFFFDYLGIETKSMRDKREEHELLLSTAKGLKELAERHDKDSKVFLEHDLKLQNNFNEFMDEIKKSVKETQDVVKMYSDNRIHDREQSLEIQEQLTGNMSKIAESDKERDEKINKLIESQKESLADRINQKYKFYLSNNGIPEDEVDEFISLHSAYKQVGGNHNGDAKFNYCMEHLPIIPVEIKLKYDTK